MEQQVIAGLVQRGVPVHIAQGIVANMIAESRLNPGINEAAPIVPGSRGGYGLNQWTGPRRRQYEAFAQSRGAPLDDLDTQLDFTLVELQGPERAAWEALQGAQDPVQAARIYSDKFLRPGIPHLDRRLSEAARLSGMPAPQMSPQGGQPAPQNALASYGAPAPQQNALAQAPQPFIPQINMLDPRAFMRPTRRG